MLDAGKRRGAGAAIVAANQHDVGVGFGHACRDRADSDLSDQLDADPGRVIGALQVVDQFGEVFDGIDVMMWRWRDETDARSGVPNSGDLRINFVTRKLSAFARLRTLRDLDLQLLSIDQIVAGDTKPPGSDLLNSAVARVAAVVDHVTRRILSAFPGIALAADAVHGNRQSFVCFFADRTVRHGASLEASDDVSYRLDFFDGNRSPGRLEFH